MESDKYVSMAVKSIHGGSEGYESKYTPSRRAVVARLRMVGCPAEAVEASVDNVGVALRRLGFVISWLP